MTSHAGVQLQDEYCSHRLRTSSGMELLTYKLAKTAKGEWSCYSSAKSTATIIGSSVASTWGTSGFGTSVGASISKTSAFNLARKNARALDLGMNDF